VRTCNYLSAAPPPKKVRGALQLVVVTADETVKRWLGQARESDSLPIRSR
jgi:hypothetical protein